MTRQHEQFGEPPGRRHQVMAPVRSSPHAALGRFLGADRGVLVKIDEPAGRLAVAKILKAVAVLSGTAHSQTMRRF